jgi:hypothetical protein
MFRIEIPPSTNARLLTVRQQRSSRCDGQHKMTDLEGDRKLILAVVA